MKSLFLLRHAKSSWGDETIDDFDRPLNARGQRAAPLMARAMVERDYRPDFILCSSALRTRQTLALMQPILGPDVPVEFERGLYHVPAPEILARVRTLDDRFAQVLVVGHNPGMEDLAAELPKAPKTAEERALMARLDAGFPTAALAILRFENASWASLRRGQGRLEALLKPRELESSE